MFFSGCQYRKCLLRLGATVLHRHGFAELKRLQNLKGP